MEEEQLEKNKNNSNHLQANTMPVEDINVAGDDTQMLDNQLEQLNVEDRDYYQE